MTYAVLKANPPPGEYTGKQGAPHHAPYGGLHVPLSRGGVKALLDTGHYSIISGGKNSENPAEKALPDNHSTFTKRHEALRKDLHAGGFRHTEVDGHYDLPEKSFLVYHGPRPESLSGPGPRSFVVHHDGDKTQHAAMRELAKKHGQQSVIHSQDGVHEVHYVSGQHEGTHHKGKGWQPLDTDTPDYYTKVPHLKGEHTKFSLNFDWGTHHPHGKAVMKSVTSGGFVVLSADVVRGLRDIGSNAEVVKAGGPGSRGGQVYGVSPSGRPLYAKRYSGSPKAGRHGPSLVLPKEDEDKKRQEIEQDKKEAKAERSPRGKTGGSGRQARRAKASPKGGGKDKKKGKKESFYKEDKRGPRGGAAAGQAAGAAMGGSDPAGAALGLISQALARGAGR